MTWNRICFKVPPFLFSTQSCITLALPDLRHHLNNAPLNAALFNVFYSSAEHFSRFFRNRNIQCVCCVRVHFGFICLARRTTHSNGEHCGLQDNSKAWCESEKLESSRSRAERQLGACGGIRRKAKPL